ncbi:Hypothetical protein GLP15_2969 [Giardia lamblia P15]|uniref:A49-like RNA polymerase I associated factor n=1 Tax=Giardia intestinalis (strain P15) TaxID=658858 RepID=E1EYV7_GIAIA|nr:Hypothetical protein GLP15_2969 [Giardia lamblia P15]
MTDKLYTVIIEEPTAKLYRVTNPGIQMKPHDFTLVKQEDGDRQLISTNKLYEAASCDSVNTGYEFDYYVVRINDGDSTVTLTPAVPVSLYLNPVHEETIKPVLQRTADNKLRSSCSLREAVNFFTTRQGTFSQSKLQGMITSTMLSTSSIAEAGGAIIAQEKARGFCNEYTNYPPFNLSTNLTSEVFPIRGLLCISVIDYCKTHTDSLSREYWSNYVQETSVYKDLPVTIGSNATSSTPAQDDKTAFTNDSTSTTSDSDEDITVSALHNVDHSVKNTSFTLELTEFAKNERERLSVLGCNQFDNTLNRPLYMNNIHYQEENGVYYYTITGIVKVWKRRGAIDYDTTIETEDIVRFLREFDFRFTYTRSSVDVSDELAIQLLERYRANLLAYAAVPGYDRCRLHDLGSLLLVLYEMLLYIMGADRYSVPITEFISGRLGCSFKPSIGRIRTIRDILPPYACAIILHFENYTVDPHILSKVLQIDIFAICRLCTSLFCKRMGKNNQRYQLKAPIVKHGETIKKRRGLQSIAFKRSMA